MKYLVIPFVLFRDGKVSSKGVSHFQSSTGPGSWKGTGTCCYGVFSWRIFIIELCTTIDIFLGYCLYDGANHHRWERRSCSYYLPEGSNTRAVKDDIVACFGRGILRWGQELMLTDTLSGKYDKANKLTTRNQL